MSAKNELPLPPEATKDAKSRELLRVWAASGGQHVTIGDTVWDDPFAWGIVLADLARHVANFYEVSRGMQHDEVLSRVIAGFRAELDHPTDTPTGKLLD